MAVGARDVWLALDLVGGTPPGGSRWTDDRTRYISSHHGIVISGDRVVHMAGAGRGLYVTPMSEFGIGHRIHVVTWPPSKFSPTMVVERASALLADPSIQFHRTELNCESFASFVRTGDFDSLTMRAFMNRVLLALEAVLAQVWMILLNISTNHLFILLLLVILLIVGIVLATRTRQTSTHEPPVCLQDAH